MKNKRHTHGGKRTPSPGKKLGRPRIGIKPKVKVSFSLDADLVTRFEKQAQVLGLTKSDALAFALDTWLPKITDQDLDSALKQLDLLDQELAKDDL